MSSLCPLWPKQEEEDIEMLKTSLAIGKAAGFPDVGEVEEMLREVGSWQRGREETEKRGNEEEKKITKQCLNR